MAKPRAWCFTLNSRVDEWAVPTEAQAGGLRYCVFQIESGEQGHRHIQGYIELTKPMRMAQVKTLMDLNEAHFEPRRGTRDQARDYCMKTDTRVDGPWEFGEFQSGGQGKRNDLVEIAAKIQAGAPLSNIVDEHPAQFIRYHRGLAVMHFEYNRRTASKRMRDLTVTVLTGDTGVGKTHSVYEWAATNNKELYKLDAGNRVWWDGYMGEDVLLIDDFYGWIKYGFLLNVLDKYPLRLEVKGGFTWANWTYVFITSNAHPQDWYKTGLTPALRRRINACYIVTTTGREELDLAHIPSDPVFNEEYYRTVPINNRVYASNGENSE